MSRQESPRLVALERTLTELISPPEEESAPSAVQTPLAPPVEVASTPLLHHVDATDPLAGWKALAAEERRWRRGERGLLRLAISILESDRWRRMMERIPLTRGKSVMPKPRRLIINRRFSTLHGRCHSDRIEIAEATYEVGALKTLQHELVHSWLMDSGAPCGHTQTFYRALSYLRGAWKPGEPRAWRYTCGACGSLQQYNEKKRRDQVVCHRCIKTNVNATEHSKIIKMAAIGSKVIPVKPERYVVFREAKPVE